MTFLKLLNFPPKNKENTLAFWKQNNMDLKGCIPLLFSFINFVAVCLIVNI